MPATEQHCFCYVSESSLDALGLHFGGCIFSVFFFFAGGGPFEGKEGRKECREKERKEERKEKKGSKKGRKKDKKERNENPARKEGRNARRKEGRKEERKEGRNPPQSRFKYLRTSRDRTHMDPFRTRDKGVCKSGGLHPAQPPRFSMPCRLVFKPRTHDKGVFKWGGGGAAPTPQLFFAPCRLSFKKIAPSTRIASNT